MCPSGHIFPKVISKLIALCYHPNILAGNGGRHYIPKEEYLMAYDKNGTFNKKMIQGRLAEDPACSVGGANNTAFAELVVITTQSVKGVTGYEDQAERHTVSLVGRDAEYARDYVRKGDMVFVSGADKTDSWEKDGVRQYRTKLRATEFQLVHRSKANQAIVDAAQNTLNQNGQGVAPAQNYAGNPQTMPNHGMQIPAQQTMPEQDQQPQAMTAQGQAGGYQPPV